jgi:PGF-pre-PGF domain-containing protein
MARWRAHSSTILGVLIFLATVSNIPQLTAYVYTYPYRPPYTYPPSIIITVHTTTFEYSGIPATNFTFDIQALDNLSFVTKLSMTTASPLSDFVIQIFQLNNVPLTVSSPSGKVLLVFQFNISPTVESIITSVEFIIRVPQLELQEFSIIQDTLQVQRLSPTPPPGSWTPINSQITGSDTTNVYLDIHQADLSLFAITGIRAQGISSYTFFALLATIVASGTVFYRRHSRKDRLLTTGKESTTPELGARE